MRDPDEPTVEELEIMAKVRSDALLSLSGLVSRIAPHTTGHHPWASRDYLEIKCNATGCFFNKAWPNGDTYCGVPSICNISPSGSCTGFKPKETPKKVDGD